MDSKNTIMRWDVINRLIKEYDCRTYLEIGVQNRVCFDLVECDFKMGVDPNLPDSPQIKSMTSDEFFASGNKNKFDLVFIDGLHEHEQVERDIVNAWNQGAKVIVLHDCNPHAEPNQRVPRETRVWYGDVWRAFVGFTMEYPKVTQYCFDFDCGVGVIVCDDTKIETGFSTDIPFSEFELNKRYLLNLQTF